MRMNASLLDKRLRDNPERTCEPDFFKSLAEESGRRVGAQNKMEPVDGTTGADRRV